jgi:hypothetical protein
MKKYKRYSAGFKEQALVKVYSRRNEQSIQSVANDLNLNLFTLKARMKKSEQDVNKPIQTKSKRPEDWNPEERLVALQETYHLNGEDLNAWCRERGVFMVLSQIFLKPLLVVVLFLNEPLYIVFNEIFATEPPFARIHIVQPKLGDLIS